ncbi:MAG: HD domain-containing protein, partial [Kiritimatiellales bacterium]|nr:HD domain-containing protein [Kiritimatiellales bacterium]
INGNLHPFLRLKADHSERVADNARQLAEDSGWKPAGANSAEALGWLHDVGRFSQFSTYGTFTDATSVNHGERGAEVVLGSGILAPLKSEEQNALLEGIRYHNAKTEPDHLDEESLRFLKLIRDADKLDIFQIVLDSVRRDGFKVLPGMLPQVALDGPVNPHVLSEIQTHRFCSIINVGSLADFLLMQLAWVYDLNYPASFRLMANRHIIDMLEQALPKERQVSQIVEAVRRFTNEHLEP